LHGRHEESNNELPEASRTRLICPTPIRYISLQICPIGNSRRGEFRRILGQVTPDGEVVEFSIVLGTSIDSGVTVVPPDARDLQGGELI
jgi:hypothetical protein